MMMIFFRLVCNVKKNAPKSQQSARFNNLGLGVIHTLGVNIYRYLYHEYHTALNVYYSG